MYLSIKLNISQQSLNYLYIHFILSTFLPQFLNAFRAEIFVTSVAPSSVKNLVVVKCICTQTGTNIVMLKLFI